MLECKDCTFANPKNGALQCRRHPPQVIVVPTQGLNGAVGLSLQTAWPGVGKTDGCGDGIVRMVAP